MINTKKSSLIILNNCNKEDIEKSNNKEVIRRVNNHNYSESESEGHLLFNLK